MQQTCNMFSDKQRVVIWLEGTALSAIDILASLLVYQRCLKRAHASSEALWDPTTLSTLEPMWTIRQLTKIGQKQKGALKGCERHGTIGKWSANIQQNHGLQHKKNCKK